MEISFDNREWIAQSACAFVIISHSAVANTHSTVCFLIDMRGTRGIMAVFTVKIITVKKYAPAGSH